MRMGSIKVFGKHSDTDHTDAVLSKVSRPLSDAQRQRMVTFLIQRCGYTTSRANAVFDKPPID